MGLRETRDFQILKEQLSSGHLPRKTAFAVVRSYLKENLYHYGVAPSAAEVAELRVAIEKGQHLRSKASKAGGSWLQRLKKVVIRITPFAGSGAVEVEFGDIRD